MALGFFPLLRERLSCLSGAVAGFLAFIASVPAVAAEETGAKSQGLPQFDASTFPSQLFWFAISFAILYLILRKAALPKIAAVQGARAETIASDLAEAGRDNEIAKETLTRVENEEAAARQAAQAARAEAKLTAERAATERLSAQGAMIAERLANAEAEIAARKAEARRNLQQTAAEIATEMAARVSGVRVDAGHAGRAVERVIKEAA